jgi:phosphate-selective porin
VIKSEGWYVQASSTVVPNRLQVVLKVEDFDPRKDNPDDSTRTTTAGVSWYLKGHDLKLMLDVLRVEVDRLDDQTKALARFQVVF